MRENGAAQGYVREAPGVAAQKRVGLGWSRMEIGERQAKGERKEDGNTHSGIPIRCGIRGVDRCVFPKHRGGHLCR
jgi:hypothetical protein